MEPHFYERSTIQKPHFYERLTIRKPHFYERSMIKKYLMYDIKYQKRMLQGITTLDRVFKIYNIFLHDFVGF